MKHSLLLKTAIPAAAAILALSGCGKCQTAWYQTDEGYINVSQAPFVMATGSISLCEPRTFQKKDLLGRPQQVTETNKVAVILSGPVTEKTLDAALAALETAPEWTTVQADGEINVGIAKIGLPSLNGPAGKQEVASLVESWRALLRDILARAK